MQKRTPEELENRLREIQTTVRENNKQRILKKVSVLNVLQYWKECCSEHNCVTHLSFTKKERGMLRNLIGRLEGVDVYQFLDFCVSRWAFIRSKMTEPGRKTSRIQSLQPSFQEIFFIKEDLLRLFTKEQGNLKTEVGQVSQPSITYTNISDIPVNHPNFRILKRLIEQTGKAVVGS